MQFTPSLCCMQSQVLLYLPKFHEDIEPNDLAGKELAGPSSFELLEDAFSKVDAARVHPTLLADLKLYHDALLMTHCWPGAFENSERAFKGFHEGYEGRRVSNHM